MATLDDSPTVFSGQSWSIWKDNTKKDLSDEQDSPEPSTREVDSKGDSMKLRKEDIGLYGICPARDEFYLVVCECCGQVIKPQALQRHLELRHNIASNSNCTSSKSSSSPIKNASSSSSSHSKDHTRLTQNAHKPTKRPNNNAPPQLHPKDKPPEVCKKRPMVKMERIETPVDVRKQHSALSKASSRSVKEHEKSKVADDVKKEIKSEKHDSEVLSEGGDQVTPTTTAVTTMSSTVSVTVATPTFSTATTAITSPRITCAASSFSKVSSTISTPPKHITTTSESSKYPTAPIIVSNSTTSSSVLSKTTAISTPPKITPAVTYSSKVTATTTSSPRITSTSSIPVSTAKTSGTASTSNSRDPPKQAPQLVRVVTTSSCNNSVKKAHPSIQTMPVTSTSVVISKPMVKPVLSSQLSSGSNSSKKSSTRKTPLCKDREYDSNKHCGVWIEDLHRQCTRSLTCKTHSLSLRRAVKGRVKPFDDLLREHREAKEALLLKTKGEGYILSKSASSSSLGSSSKVSAKSSSVSFQPKSAPTTPMTTIPIVFKSPSIEAKIAVPIVTSPAPVEAQLPVKEKLPLSSSITRQSLLPIFAKNEPVPVPESTSYMSSDGEEEEEENERMDYSYLTHHPQPAAINTFGSWRHGLGTHVFNRREDLYRTAFYAAVERHLHPPPHKKLCVESKLPKGSTISTNTKDPYDFTFGDGTQGQIRKSNIACRVVSKPVTKTKSIIGNSPPSSSSKSGLFPALSPSNSVTFSSGFDFSDIVVSSTNNCLQSPTSAKRKRSGSSPITQNITNVNNGMLGTALLDSSTNSSIGITTACSSPIAITIPASLNFNLSSSTLSNINATFANAQVLRSKNPVVNDVGKGYTDSGAQVNGQLGYLSGSNPADVTHLQLNSLSEKCAKAKSNKNKAQKQIPSSPVLGKVQLNKSPTIRKHNKTSPILSLKPSNSLSLTPVISSLGGFMHLDTQLSNSIGGSSMTLTSTSGGSSDSVSSTQVSPLQLASPVLLSGTASPTSPPPNGMLSPTRTPSKLSDNGNHDNHFCGSDVLSNSINLTLTEQLLAQHGSGFSMSPVKPESGLLQSISTGSVRGSESAQAQLSAAAATAQQLAAAALNLTTQSSCLLTTNNSTPQQLYATHVLAKSSSPTQLGSLQLQARPSLKTVGGSLSKMPIQPLSLTILGPGGMVASSQHQQPHLVLHTTEEAHATSNIMS